MSNNFDLYKQSLVQWRDYSAIYIGTVEPTWDKLDIPWQQTFCIEEIPTNDNWGTTSTVLHMWLEEKFVEWNNIKEATEHQMSISPKLDFDISSIINILQCQEHLCNFMQIPNGRLIPWHCDTYGHFVKTFNAAAQNLSRAIVFMENWTFGQTVQLGNSVLSHWKAGDIYSWDNEAWHGAANFGNQPFTIMQITYDKTTNTSKS